MIYDRRKELDEATVRILNESRKEMKELKKQVKIQSKFVVLTTAGFLVSLGTTVFLYLKYIAKLHI